jgi:hypothetical protein
MTIVVPASVQTKEWSDWYDSVLPFVPGCPRTMAANAIRHAAREFCLRSRAYRSECEPIDIEANTAEYDFPTPSGTDVVKVLEARLEDAEIAPASTDQLRREYRQWATLKGAITHFTQVRPDKIRLFRIPETSVAGGLTVLAALAPEVHATSIAMQVWEHYHEPIAHGAIARLAATPKKPYTDYPAAGHYKGLFDAAIGSALTDAASGFNRSKRRVKAHYF